MLFAFEFLFFPPIFSHWELVQSSRLEIALLWTLVVAIGVQVADFCLVAIA
jgi:hypothetical protein